MHSAIGTLNDDAHCLLLVSAVVSRIQNLILSLYDT